MDISDVKSKEIYQRVKCIIDEIKTVVLGKDEIIIQVFSAILARGHILIEDVPGVGKTTLALAFSKALSLDYKRLQFTPDVLPSDVTGFSIFDKKTNTFIYNAGAAMCNLFLADEINRTSSKTQSALLEVMEEGKVTVDGVTREVPKPYIVIATQNPIGSAGTQMLPDSQLDRFMIRVSMGYPDTQSEIDILKGKQSTDPLESINKVVTGEDIEEMQTIVDQTYVSDEIYSYITNLVKATRNNSNIKLGVSPRGTIALTRIAKATAFLHGRDYVIPEDVQYVFRSVAEHRILLSSKARISELTTAKLLAEIQAKIPVPQVK